MYNIGIIKFGTVINENNFKNEGSNNEIINFIDIMSKKHNVFIVSSLAKNSRFKKYNGEKLDIIFAYNGIWSITNTSKFGGKALNCFERHTYPSIEFINNCDIPWVFFNSDIRYKLSTPKELKRMPDYHIGLYEDGNMKYEHFDKIHCYNYKTNYCNYEKNIEIGIIMNDTHKLRTSALKTFITWCDNFNWNIKGKFKESIKYNTGFLLENEVFDFLKNVKYTILIASEPNSTTQKLWECIANNVVCFLYGYDMQCNNININSFLRVKDEIDFEEKVNLLNNDNKLKNKILEHQRSQLKDSYIDGSFILNHYTKLIEKIIC